MKYVAPVNFGSSSGSASGNYVAPVNFSPSASNPNITAALNYISPYEDTQSPDAAARADSVLGNIGSELSGLTKSSSGIQGLIDPQIAQQMDRNPASTIQNYLSTTMGIPPQLLQKMMMGEGAIPQMESDNQPSYLENVKNNLLSSLGGMIPVSPSENDLKSGLAGLATNIPSRIPSGMATPFGIGALFNPKENLSLGDKKYIPTRKSLGVRNTPGANASYETTKWGPLALSGADLISSLAEKSPEIAELASSHIPRLPAPGTLSVPQDKIPVNFESPLDHLHIERGSVPGLKEASNNAAQANLDTEHLGSVVRNGVSPYYQKDLMKRTNGYGVAGQISKDYLDRENYVENLYNSRQIHGNKVPSFLRSSSASVSKNAQTITPAELAAIRSKDPVLHDVLSKKFGIQGPNENPVSKWLTPDEYKLAKTNAPKELGKLEENPTINNLHTFGKRVRRVGGTKQDFHERESLFDLGDKAINGVKSGLQEMDSLHGTQTAAPYGGADQYFKKNVAPYRATPKLYSIATGNFPNAEPEDALKEIQKGQRSPSKYNFDINGMPNAKIPVEHKLSSMVPNLDHLSQFKSNRVLKNLTEGRSTLPTHKISGAIDNAVENGEISENHPLNTIFNSPMKESLSRQNAANNALSQAQKEHSDVVGKTVSEVKAQKNALEQRQKNAELKKNSIKAHIAKRIGKAFLNQTLPGRVHTFYRDVK